MKKILGFFIASAALAPIIAPGSAIRAARVTERAASTGSGRGGNARVKRVMKPTAKQCSTEIEYCINYYCSGGDSIGGDKSYVDVCGGRPASAIKPGVESCLRSRTIIKSIDYSTCSTLIQAQVQAAIADWAQHDANVKYASAECKKQQEALGFAKKCHSALLASDGAQSNALRSKLESLCGRPAGGTDEMLGRFYNAGAYGYSDLQAQNDLMTTGQAGARRENWRQTADAVLVGYSEMAELACGFENYSITKVNQYQLDSRDNVAMAGAKAEAAALGQLKAERQVAEMYRKQDCLARALPANANHWEWIEGGDPACRVACAGGYVRQGSESCMAQHSKLDTSPMAVAAPFFGINLGQEPEHITSRDLRPEVKPAPAVPAEKDNPDPKPDDDKGGVNCATCSCSNAECKAKCAKCNRKGGDSCADCPQHAYGSDAYNNASDDYWIGKLKCRYEKQCCIFGGPFAPGDATTENKRLIRAGIDKKILTATWTYRLCESDGKTYAHTATQGGGGGNCKCSNDTSTDDKFVESLECRALDNTNCCIYNSTLNTDKIRNNGLIGTWRFCNGGGTFTWPENPDPAVGGDDYKDHICTRINGLINQNNFNDLRAFAYEKLPNNESMEPWITSKFPNAVSAYRTTYLTYANLGLVGGTIQVDAKCLADGLRQTAAEIGCSGIPIVDMIGIDCSEMQPPPVQPVARTLEDGIANIQPGNEITVDQSVTTTLPAGAYDFKISGGSGSGGGVCINNGKKTGPGYNSVIPRVISLNNIQLLESANRANYDIVITIGPIARGASSGGGCPYIHLLNFQAHSGNKGADTTLEIPGATINETAKGGCGAEGGKGGSNLNLSQKEDQCSVVNRSKAARGAYVADGKIIEAEDGLSGYVIITRKK